MGDLRILQLSDIHGSDFLIDEITPEIKKANLVVLPGDITHFGNGHDVKRIIDKIRKNNTQILSVSGNCDLPDVESYLSSHGYGLHRSIESRFGINWLGIGGSLPCPGTTPNEYSDKTLASWLEILKEDVRPPLALLVHQPPFNTMNDRLPDGSHVGSKSLRQFIEEVTPMVCLTAHIHEGIGIDRIKNCMIINPGPFRTGKYAIINISGKKSVSAELKQITV
jgi:Icc-related predicted phosphoesterase